MAIIQVVDDEQDLCEILQFNLESEGYKVATANSAEEALASGVAPDLILLDVMMDKMSGFEMATLLRSQGNNVPIIFLTAKSEHDDQMKGFEVGADDYIAKPFSFDTVLARVKAVLKRSQTPAHRHSGTLVIDGVELLVAENKVLVSNTEVELTNRECLILHLMMQYPDRHLSREEILQKAWPNDTYVGDRSVDVHIARIRKKLGSEAWHLVNKTGLGYAFITKK